MSVENLQKRAKTKGKDNIGGLQQTLAYMAKLILIIPYPELARSKAKELIQLANKKQVGLGKLKQFICKKCSSVLIPGRVSENKMVRTKQGYGLLIRCTNCYLEKFTPIRGTCGIKQSK